MLKTIEENWKEVGFRNLKKRIKKKVYGEDIRELIIKFFGLSDYLHGKRIKAKIDTLIEKYGGIEIRF